MTEKRFKLNLDSEWWGVKDNTIKVNEHGYRDDLTGEDRFRGLKQELTEQETVDLLNQLNEENKQLKQDGFYWAQTAEARRKEIDKLRKDNTILKQQRDYLFDVIDEVLPHSGSTTVYNRMKNIGDVE